MLEAERYDYQKFSSDIAGQDIRQHGNDPKVAVSAVRDWLAASRSHADPTLSGATAIMTHYRGFKKDLPAMLAEVAIKPRELGFFDHANLMGQFVRRRAARLAPRGSSAG